MKKKFLFSLLAILTFLTTVSIFAACADPKDDDGDIPPPDDEIVDMTNLIYKLSDDGSSYVVTGAASQNEALYKLRVPDEYNGRPVTEISESAFADEIWMESALIGKNIKKIDTKAFFGCTALAEIDLPEQLESLGKQALKHCDKIVKTIGGVDYVGNWAVGVRSGFGDFSDGLLSFRSGTVGIAEYIAGNNDEIKSIALPAELRYICEGAFFGCGEITTVTIPGSVKKISDSVFYNALKLKTVVLGEGIENIENFAFFRCKSLADITLPASLKGIAPDAFGQCHKECDFYRHDRRLVCNGI